jgi:hypothetical protein
MIIEQRLNQVTEKTSGLEAYNKRGVCRRALHELNSHKVDDSPDFRKARTSATSIAPGRLHILTTSILLHAVPLGICGFLPYCTGSLLIELNGFAVRF